MVNFRLGRMSSAGSSMRPTVQHRHYAILLLLCLSSSIISVAYCWDYGDYMGPASWNISFPNCDDTISSFTQSPIQLGNESDTAQNISRRFTFARTSTKQAWEAKFSIGTAPGGPLVVFTPAAGKEVILTVTTTSEVNGEISGTVEEKDLVLSQVVVHSGVEHLDKRRPLLLPGEFEVQLFISTSLDQSVAPKYIIGVSFSSRSGTSSSNVTTVIGDILESTSVAIQQMKEVSLDTSTVSVVSTSKYVLPLGADFSEVFSYTGRESFPPCTGGTSTTVMYATSVVLPVSKIDTYTSLLSLSPTSTATVRPPQQRGNIRTVEKVSMQFTGGTLPAPIIEEEVVVEVVHVEGEVNETLRNLMVALSMCCLAVTGYIILLLSARAGHVDVPTWLGGLKKPVHFWTNPPTAHSRQQLDVGGGSFNSDEEMDDEDDEYDVARVDGPSEQEADSEVSMSDDDES